MTQQEHIEAALEHLAQTDQCPPDGQTVSTQECLLVTCAGCWGRFIFGSDSSDDIIKEECDQ